VIPIAVLRLSRGCPSRDRTSSILGAKTPTGERRKPTKADAVWRTESGVALPLGRPAGAQSSCHLLDEDLPLPLIERIERCLHRPRQLVEC